MLVWSRVISPPLSLRVTVMLSVSRSFVMASRSDRVMLEDTVFGRHGWNTRFFLERGCYCQGKEVVPVDHIRGKALSSRLASGSKIRLTAGFEPCPQGPAPSSLAAAYAPFKCVPSLVHSIPVLAASHSSLA